MNGTPKYSKLSQLALTVSLLSHGNADPERGFSINANLLDIHGPSIKEEKIESLRLVKDFLNNHGGAKSIEITSKLRQYVQGDNNFLNGFVVCELLMSVYSRG